MIIDCKDSVKGEDDALDSILALCARVVFLAGRKHTKGRMASKGKLNMTEAMGAFFRAGVFVSAAHAGEVRHGR